MNWNNITEVCWNITTRCNLDCLFCHRFLNINELSLSDNMIILDNLYNWGLREITWTGGEALLYDGITKLLSYSRMKGINNKLISNGIAVNSNMDVLPYLNTLTLSLDSIDNEINVALGRGQNHFAIIHKLLEQLKCQPITPSIVINTVITKLNIKDLYNLMYFIAAYPIAQWRIFRFSPLRNSAIINKSTFEVSDYEFECIKDYIKSFYNAPVCFRNTVDLERNYLLITANGDLVQTINNTDIVLGNCLDNKLNIGGFFRE